VTLVTVVGAEGFVGSAFVHHLSSVPDVELREVTRRNYALSRGRASDVTIDCAGNSRKYVADERPLEDFDLSVAHRLRTIQDFPAALQVHISSVDVYGDLTSPDTTQERSSMDATRSSRYGFHKWLAEELVRHYCPRWIIVRLAGMVGPGLRKNPVYDILNRQPLRIHPDSQYQFLHTQAMARDVWDLLDAGHEQQIFNVCGAGLISPREIARLAGVSPDVSQLPPEARPRIVNVSNGKIRDALKRDVASTHETVRSFVRDAPSPGPLR
jgi:nucleoside-diphosphate-sugar epimerase